MPTLQWLTRDEDVRAAEKVPYRLLEEDPALGYGDRDTGNMLIQGDNLEALKSLLPFYAGQVKCIYIDPPYNTGSAFEHYDDNLEHSKWLAMMWPRLELLRDLLAEDGSIWVSIDDWEAHYLKIMLDEIFGRRNFVSNVIWQKVYSIKGSAKHLSDMHDHIHVFARNIDQAQFGLVARTEKNNKMYKNPDNDPDGDWRPGPLAARNFYSLGTYPITCPSGRVIDGPPDGSYWRYSKEKFDALDREGKIWWGKDGNNVPAPKLYLKNVAGGTKAPTLWKYEDVGHNQDAKRESLALFPKESFGTPKPEKLIERIIQLATNPDDLVLDSFLGSGTTAAVAQKMGRRFIGIEMGDHAVTHCQPRQVKVTDGEQGGISKAQDWQGGGGFRFYRLGSPVFDDMGQLQPDIRFPTLAAHIWFSEFNHPWTPPSAPTPFLGQHKGAGLALLYNGILGDKSVNGGNVLTRKTLAIIRDAAGGFDGPMTIYGERTVLADASLDAENIVFKQTPYDVRARK